jgi:hypothetical protein
VVRNPSWEADMGSNLEDGKYLYDGYDHIYASDDINVFKTKWIIYNEFKPLVPAAFVIVSTNQPALGPVVVGYGSFCLCVIHKEGLYPSSGNINRLMMMNCLLLAEHQPFLKLEWAMH